MTNKVKINAKTVVRDMKDQELEKYTIDLTPVGKGGNIPPWFKPYGKIIEQTSKVIEQMSQFMIDQQKFNNEMIEFKKFVMKQFKKHGWID